MNYKFLNKVLDQLVSETRVDYKKGVIYFPFFSMVIAHFKMVFIEPSPQRPLTFLQYFYDHCKDIYGLNEQETDYIWVEYISIIKNKVKKG
jgi:hypothetical protein